MARVVNRLPREGINVSSSHPLKELALLLTGVVGVVVLLTFLLSMAVDVLVPYIPVKYEVRFFSAVMAQVKEKSEKEKDDRTAKLQTLIDRLAAHWPENPYDFELGVIESGTPNAMALPGGVVMVTSGLLDMAESENEVAFVLGHELGHFSGRDHMRSLGRGVIVGLLLSVVTGGYASGNASDLLSITGMLASRGFDRDQERRADLFGLRIVQAEYGHVGGACDFFSKVEKLYGEEPAGLPVYFAAHPVTSERIEYLRTLALERGWPAVGEVSPISWNEKTD